MIKSIRHKSIIDTIEKDGFIGTEDIARKYNVSLATARRDLDELEIKGFLRRKYGGAESVNNSLFTPGSFLDRQKKAHDEKLKIAKKALELIPDNAIIALDSGSTVYELCTLLKERSGLTIICSDIHSADCLLSGPSENKVYFMGGFLTKDGSSTCDFAEKLLSRIAGIDIFFLSGDGLDPTDGISSFDYGVNELNRCYLKKAKKTVALIDNTKLQRKGFYKVCGLDELDLIIFDDKLSEHLTDVLKKKGIPYIKAE